MSEAAMTAEIRELSEGAAILVLRGDIDLATASTIAPHFRALADEGRTKVIIDAREVEFMDSTGVEALMEGKRIIFERGSRILLVASPAVRRVLDLVFPEPQFAARFDTIEEAMAELQSESA